MSRTRHTEKEKARIFREFVVWGHRFQDAAGQGVGEGEPWRLRTGGGLC